MVWRIALWAYGIGCFGMWTFVEAADFEGLVSVTAGEALAVALLWPALVAETFWVWLL